MGESSMFVAHRRFILKTCGNTTPLLCLKPLLHLVEQYAGYDEVEDVFYSRKNFKRPDLQLAPHHSFEEEVALLDTFFNDGAAYCLGTINRDCWYLYTLNPIEHNQNKLCCDISNGIDKGEPDQTLEILMSDLDRRIMNVFTKEFSTTAAEATKKSGIDKLMPNMVIDDFLFEPCGYSMNGISKNVSSH
ncbi:hypothetical protein J437_LFUL011332 [Ladona fulva]|uniref:Adenosylmethionine decarboxylase n=1 Tax=Ladona fulva TaxID=123851 RepID=A0A8K0P2P3_LADFU|nr:hypothetical protein J437_LFUL011332 [Ladona fulva]